MSCIVCGTPDVAVTRLVVDRARGQWGEVSYCAVHDDEAFEAAARRRSRRKPAKPAKPARRQPVA